MKGTYLMDKNLSLKAKGLLCTIISLPKDWNFSLNNLEKILKEGKRSIRSTLKELIDNKYLIILKLKAVKDVRNSIEYSYSFYEKPYTKENIESLLKKYNKNEIISIFRKEENNGNI